MQITILDVAEKAGVSISTVSRVLNKTCYVDPEKSERVRAAIEALRFRPRTAARALAGKGTRTIGLVVPEISGEFFLPLLRGVESAASEAGYGLLVRTTKAGVGDGGIHDEADGLLLFADSVERRLLEELACRGKPAVLLYTEAPPGLELPSVLVENEEGARAAVLHLIDEHRRARIVCLTSCVPNHDGEARLRGYRSALEARSLPFDPELLAPGDFDPRRAAASVRALLDSGAAFDAVFAGDDGAALGVLAALGEAGIEAGREVSVVGFDDQAFAAGARPALATVRAPTERVGSEAVGLLLRKIHGESKADSIVLPTSFVARASCGCTEAAGESGAASIQRRVP